MPDKIDEEEYRRMRRIASYHLLRVSALVGVFVGKAFGALVALVVAGFADLIYGTMIVPIRGTDVPVLGVTQLLATIVLLKVALEMQLNDTPEIEEVPP